MSEQSNVTPLREFDAVVRLCSRKLETLDETEKKTTALQIDIGALFIELRDRVNAGEIGEQATWWDWYEDNRMKFRNLTRETALRYMRIAGADDPVAKVAEHRRQGADRQATFRGKKKSSNQALLSGSNASSSLNPPNVVKIPAAPKPEKPPITPEQMELADQFEALYRQMTDDVRVIALKRIDDLERRWREGYE